MMCLQLLIGGRRDGIQPCTGGYIIEKAVGPQAVPGVLAIIPVWRDPKSANLLQLVEGGVMPIQLAANGSGRCEGGLQRGRCASPDAGSPQFWDKFRLWGFAGMRSAGRRSAILDRPSLRLHGIRGALQWQ
jgi:hypothetical protein